MARFPFLVFLLLVPSAQGDEKRLAELAKSRYETAAKTYQELFRDGVYARDLIAHYTLSVHLLNAERDYKTDKHIDAYQSHYDRMKALEDSEKKRESIGSRRAIVESFRIEAEHWLERAKSRKNKE